MRLLFWALIGALVVYALRSLGGAPRGTGGPNRAANAPENMVRCQRCGLNLPQSDAVAVAGKWACCAEHAQPQYSAARDQK